jgi:hypothetical protein
VTPPPPPPAAPTGGESTPTTTGGTSTGANPTTRPTPTGAARLSGPTRCVAKTFNATVVGRQIARVRFYVDGKLASTRTTANGPGNSFRLAVDPATYGTGQHRVVARIQFRAAARTSMQTKTFTFRRCDRSAVAPGFTG